MFNDSCQDTSLSRPAKSRKRGMPGADFVQSPCPRTHPFPLPGGEQSCGRDAAFKQSAVAHCQRHGGAVKRTAQELGLNLGLRRNDLGL